MTMNTIMNTTMNMAKTALADATSMNIITIMNMMKTAPADATTMTMITNITIITMLMKYSPAGE